MLVGLIFRGVAFEYRHLANTSKRFWDAGFMSARWSQPRRQALVLGNFIVGFRVNGRQFAGTSFDWTQSVLPASPHSG
jgi:cytochrome d ubiquinol oxidase subunit II